ncbi:hypothetical protein FRC12_015695 [Ceratobasidium sp. 428]|nr:hypothetical protein FRC12_015695 [Ceratobasidium sp. 428]
MAPATYRQSQTNSSAPAQEDLWGPEFDEYSARRFEGPELTDMSQSEIERFLHKYHTLPLQAVESQLCETDPRAGTLDELAGVPIADSINRLWRYVVQNTDQGRALKYYYGFICLRHMLFTTSSAILRATGTLYPVVQSLHPDASWNDWARNVAFRAIEITAGAMADPGSFGHFCKLFTRNPFISDVSGNATKVDFFITALYESRDRFLTLCLRGGVDWSDENKQFKSLDDTQTIATTYYALFAVSQNQVDISTIPIHFMGHLAGFVLHTAAWTPEVTTEQVIKIARIAVQFFWLLLERRGRLSITDHSKVRFYAANLFGFFG